ncbi:MAG TPA: serine/threonine-protein kinase, partial [Candidatus Binatia bacterium]|nr:serine/threonine-protein kinase [Candidatus Binatia bacterium]
MPLTSGTTLGHYRVLAPLGVGGMGEVYRAHDPRLQRDVAIKVLPPDAVLNEEARTRLVREARTASSLNHPHIAHIYEVGKEEGALFIVMELVEGSPLAERIRGGTLAADSIPMLALQIASALEYAHKRGVIHRDLKSANVMVTPEGWAKVLDFGLAKRVQDDSRPVSAAELDLTRSGLILGTPNYLPPEVLLGGKADARSDVWSFGVMLYEMTMGRLPFGGGSVVQLADAIVNAAPGPVSGRVPVGLRAVIEKCLAKEPDAR